MRPIELEDPVKIVEGPLAGTTGIVHEIDQTGDILTVLVETKAEGLYPPLPFERRQLKLDVHLGLAILVVLVCLVGTAIAVVMRLNGFSMTRIIVYLSTPLAVPFFAYLLYLKRVSKSLKTCPSCDHPLEPDTSYSTCTACPWQRPMPPRGAQHLREFESRRAATKEG